ncbi:MAG: ATP-binding protein [Caldilineaceae bacterium]
MLEFVDRQKEIATLNSLHQRRHGQFVTVYGRRRVGKTTLLRYWVEQTDYQAIYWVARREMPEAVRHSLARALWRAKGREEPPTFSSWETLFEELSAWPAGKPAILIFDEFPYAVESDPSLPSHLQAAWDLFLKDQPIILILAGSHIGMMVELFDYQAPLHGRFTAQLHVGPLPFAALTEFFPNYAADERVATYAVLGGVPGYLNRFDPNQALSANVRQHLFQPVGMFRSEPLVQISDLVREPRHYEATLRAIATGNHTLSEIAKATGIAPTNLPTYLKSLIALGMIERRLPATVPPDQRRKSKRGRYHLRDAYLRFYFRFIEPNLEMIEFGQADLLWERIGEQFRSFIGATAWEELCREWVLLQANLGQLPFPVELVGSHWSATAQIDVVAINWRDKALLLGECKWTATPIGVSVIRELVAKTSHVAPAPDWQVYYAFFACAGFTPEARREAQAVHALLVDLETVDADLHRALQNG